MTLIRITFIILAMFALSPISAMAQTAEARAWLEVAQDYLNDSNPEQALQALDRFREINRADVPQSYYLRAVSERSLNRVEEAMRTITQYKSSSAVAPNSASHRSMMEMETQLAAEIAASRRQAEENRRAAARQAFEREVNAIRTVQNARSFSTRYATTNSKADADRLVLAVAELETVAGAIQANQRTWESVNQQKIELNNLGFSPAERFIVISSFVVACLVGPVSALATRDWRYVLLGPAGLVLAFGTAMHHDLKYLKEWDKLDKSHAAIQNEGKVLQSRHNDTDREIQRIKSRILASHVVY